MNDKLQEYLNVIASEKKGEDVRSATQKAFIAVNDEHEKQKVALNKFYSDLNSQLDESWEKLQDIFTAHGGGTVTIEKFLNNPELAGGFNDIKSFRKALVTLLKTATPLNSSLSDVYSDTSEISTGITYAFPRYEVVEDIKLAYMLNGYSQGYSFAMKDIRDVSNLILDFSFLQHYTGGDILPSGEYSDPCDDRPLVCLSSTAPPSNIINGSQFLQYRTGSTSPASLPVLNNQTSMTLDTIYVLNNLGSNVKTIELNKSQLQGAKYFIMCQLNGTPIDIGYQGDDRTLLYGSIDACYVRMIMVKEAFLER